jgi:ABC-2 type transport system permease protein
LQVQGIPDSWVFCRPEAPGAEEAINEESPITSGLQEIFFPVPGTIKPNKDSELEFTALVKTGSAAGTISSRDFMENQSSPLLMKAAQGRPEGPQIIAARITGTLEDDQSMSDEGYQVAQADTDPAADEDSAATADEATADDASGDTDDSDASSDDTATAEQEVPEAPEEEKKRSIDVVYVADIDLMISTFLRIRARPGEDEEIEWNFENVDFLLNIVDSLSGDDDYIAIRKRKPRHSTLRMVERRSQQMREREFEKRFEFQQEYDKAVSKFEEENEKKVKEIQDQLEELQNNARKQGQTGIKFADLQEKLQELATTQERLNRMLEVQKEQLSRKRDDAIEGIRQEIELDILAIKNVYKAWAVFLPPIPPLLVGLIVYVRRRLREREGIDRSRLR